MSLESNGTERQHISSPDTQWQEPVPFGEAANKIFDIDPSGERVPELHIDESSEDIRSQEVQVRLAEQAVIDALDERDRILAGERERKAGGKEVDPAPKLYAQEQLLAAQAKLIELTGSSRIRE